MMEYSIPRVQLIYSNNNFDSNQYYGCNQHLNSKINSKKINKIFYIIESNYNLGLLSPATFYRTNENKPLICDKSQPNIILNRNTYTDFNWNDSYFSYCAFWAFPIFKENLLTESMRSDWKCLVQWILLQSGCYIGVYLKEIYKQSFNSSYCKNNLNFIKDCSYTNSLKHCLIKNMINRFDKTFMNNFKFWLQILTSLNYKFSNISYTSLRNKSIIFESMNLQDKIYNVKHLIKNQAPIANVKLSKSLFYKTCSKNFQNLSFMEVKNQVELTNPWFQKSSILLLIVFNNPHYEIISYLEILYRSHFPRILYCGPKMLKLVQYPNLKNYKFSFITYDTQPNNKVNGSLNYQCTLQAIKMYYKLEGILTIADDLLIFFNPISKFHHNKIWTLPIKDLSVLDISKEKECILGFCNFQPKWVWWSEQKNQTQDVWNNVKILSSITEPFKKCYNNLINITGGINRLIGGFSDIYYIPSHINEDFMKIIKLFLKKEVFLEIAIQIVLNCLANEDEKIFLNGLAIWDTKTRDIPWNNFKRSKLFGNVFYHPIKWSALNNNKSQQINDLFCNKVTPFLFDPLSRFPI